MRALKLGVGSVFFATAMASWFACGGSDGGNSDTANDASVTDTGATTTRSDAGGGKPGDDGGTVLPDGAINPGTDSSVPDGAPPVLDAGASVLQHHNHASRDGMYIEPTFTKTSVATLHADATFSAIIADGPVYAQPLYVEPGPNGKEVLIVATEQNFVYAFDAADGSIVWKTPQLASPVSSKDLPCGNIDTLGITSTPIIDFPSRTIFLGAMTTPDNGATKKHKIYALDLDTGNVRTGWPVDVEAGLASSASPFKSTAQSQRGALALVGGILYVPYGGFYGDCSDYHGRVVAIPIATPTQVTGFATSARAGGIWASGGPSSDGTSIFVTTGNTSGTSTWAQGEAVIRLTNGTTFSNAAADYYAPANWKALDDSDIDLGGAAAVPVDLTGATPSKLILALGKDRNAYLLDRTNLGGIGKEIGKLGVAGSEINGAATVYRTATATYAVFRGGKGAACTNGGTGTLVALTIKPGTPPTLQPSWCGTAGNVGSPIVTTTDGTAEAVVWGTAGNSLTAIDGDTGKTIVTGASVPGDVSYFNTPIVAKGRVFVVSSTRLNAFKL